MFLSIPFASSALSPAIFVAPPPAATLPGTPSLRWQASNSGVALGSTVTSIPDSSGNGYAGTVYGSPVVRAGYNSHPAYHMDGSAAALSAPAAAAGMLAGYANAPNGWTVAVVFRPDASPVGGYVMCSDNSSQANQAQVGRITMSTSSPFVLTGQLAANNAGRSTCASSQAVSTSVPTVAILVCTSSSSVQAVALFVNGTKTSPNATGGVVSLVQPNRLTFGAGWSINATTGSPIAWMATEYYDIIIWPTSLTDAQAQQATTYLQQSYSTSVYTPVDSTYSLVFDEEFNGTSFDSSKWSVLDSQTLNNVVVKTANAAVANGVCSLTLAGNTSSQTGAFITTNGHASFSASGGAVYIEARCKMPTSPAEGLWPAFWMNNNGNFPEIDVFEWLGVHNASQFQTYHNPNDGSAPPTGTTGYGFDQQSSPGIGDLSQAYHVYGVLWTTSAITWFIDGVQTYQLTNGQSISGYWSGGAATVNITGGPQMINLQIGANGFGGQNNTIDSSTVLPAVFKIDYVHVYQVGGTAVTPQTGYGGPGDTVGSGN